MQDLEQQIIDQQYGAQATPILIEDKSIEGLIRANCKKKERSKLFTFRLLIP